MVWACDEKRGAPRRNWKEGDVNESAREKE